MKKGTNFFDIHIFLNYFLLRKIYLLNLYFKDTISNLLFCNRNFSHKSIHFNYYFSYIIANRNNNFWYKFYCFLYNTHHNLVKHFFKQNFHLSDSTIFHKKNLLLKNHLDFLLIWIIIFHFHLFLFLQILFHQNLIKLIRIEIFWNYIYPKFFLHLFHSRKLFVKYIHLL